MKHFKNYEQFLLWAYEIKDEKEGTFPRLKLTLEDGFVLDDSPSVIYKRVMDCLHSHEEN